MSAGERRRWPGYAAPLLLALLMAVAWRLHGLVQLDGAALDVDVINFGLAGFAFDVLKHQPQPPGYPGYVLLLKAVHALAPALGPLQLAVLTCQLVGVLTVPAALWAARGLLGSGAESGPPWRALAAAAVAAVHPLLWYYGGDGQAHGAEALAMLLLFGAAARLSAQPGVLASLGFATLAGLAGALRPTVSLFAAPLLIWQLWGRPWRHWVGAACAGAAGVLVWWLPLVGLSGGWLAYQRATDALVGGFFVGRMSPFAGGLHVDRLLSNAGVVGVYLIFAVLPLLTFERAPARRPWALALAASVGLSAVFYELTFVVEAGYLTAAAALSCLAPASWQGPPRRALPRVALAVLVPPLLFVFGPASVHLPGLGSGGPLPTVAAIAQADDAAELLVRRPCLAAGGAPFLVVTDNLVITHSRTLPVVCPGAQAAVVMAHPPMNPALDNWLVFDTQGLWSLPTSIPLEPGPPTDGALRAPVALVMVAVDASEALARRVASLSACAPLSGWPDGKGGGWPQEPIVWAASCVPGLKMGGPRIAVPAAP